MSEPSSTVLPPSPTPRDVASRRAAATTTPADAAPRDELTVAAIELLGIFRVVPHQLPAVPAIDLTMGQIRLMLLLRRDGPQPMGRLAELFDLSPNASSGLVARVERHGLVIRRHRSDDRRIVECDLTEAGIRFLHELSGDRIDTIRTALSTLEPAELAEFRRLVRRIHEGQGAHA